VDPRRERFHLVLVDRGRRGIGQHHGRQHAGADDRVVVLLHDRLQAAVAHRLGQRRVDAGDVGRIPGGGAAEVVVDEDQVGDRLAAEVVKVQRGPGRETRRELVGGQLRHARTRPVVVGVLRLGTGQQADVQRPAHGRVIAFLHRSPKLWCGAQNQALFCSEEQIGAVDTLRVQIGAPGFPGAKPEERQRACRPKAGDLARPG
jgi:hypothetical protein